MVSQLRAAALAALDATEEDLAGVVRLDRQIEDAVATRDSAIVDAATARDRLVSKALTGYGAAVVKAVAGSSTGAGAGGNGERGSDRVAALTAALDSAHARFREAVVAAVQSAESAVAAARLGQGAALGRVRDRGGMPGRELAEMVGMSPAEISALIRGAERAQAAGGGQGSSAAISS